MKALNIFFISVLTVSMGTLAATPPEKEGNSVEHNKSAILLELAASTLDHVIENPGNGIPQSLIHQSEVFVIFPRACQVAAGAFNGAGGKGVAMIYNEDGSWSTPFFVTLREGDLGFRMGRQNSDILLLIKDRNDITGMNQSSITLGSDVGIAPGPDLHASSSCSEYDFKSGIYSYQLVEGLCTGVNLKGAILGYSGKFDDALYSFESSMNDQVEELMLAFDIFRE